MHAPSGQSPADTPLYPLLLEPRLVERPWGGARLPTLLGKGRPADGGRGPIGESWETAVESRVADGPLAGRALGDLARERGPALIGRRPRATPDVPFPLLLKFLDAAEVLSVQVHPGDAYAQARLGEPFGKTEAWYIIAAAPDAAIYHGLRGLADRDAVAEALRKGRIADHLRAVPVRAGDTLFTPAGTVHAIGPGIVLYEIQQYSDATFRLYDWERRDAAGHPRETHLDRGLEVLDTGAPTQHITTPQALDERGERLLLLACRHFALELLAPVGAGDLALDTALDGESFHLLSVLAGASTIAPAGGAPVEATLGQTALLPAALGAYRLIVPADGRLLRAFVPDLVADVVAPLRARGVPDDRIAQLGGGFPRGNDLLPLLANADTGGPR